MLSKVRNSESTFEKSPGGLREAENPSTEWWPTGISELTPAHLSVLIGAQAKVHLQAKHLHQGKEVLTGRR